MRRGQAEPRCGIIRHINGPRVDLDHRRRSTARIRQCDCRPRDRFRTAGGAVWSRVRRSQFSQAGDHRRWVPRFGGGEIVRAALGLEPVAAALDGFANDLGHLRQLINAHEAVHLGEQFQQVLAKSLGQATGHDHTLGLPVVVSQRRGLEDGIHAFLLGGFDERAGVDDDRIGLAGIVGDFDAVAQEGAEHDFGVHQILGATQRDHANPQPVFVQWLRFQTAGT